MYTKFATELFLGKFELIRFKESLDDSGFRLFLLQNTLQFGLIRNTNNFTWDNGLVEQGTNVGTIKHKELKAINKDGNLIYKQATDDVLLTNDNNWYWVKVAHLYNPNEIGTISIDANGNMVGIGTEFLKTLRGQPDFPSKIKFTNAVNNTSEYEVLSVIDNNNAILQGANFSTEINLNYALVGTFTPGKTISSQDKYPQQYDGCIMSFELETMTNTPPTLSTNQIDYQFYIARVRRNNNNIYIEDKRELYVWQTRADYNLKNLYKPTSMLPIKIVGVESIKYDVALTPKDRNIIYMGWSFRSSNWSVDTNTNKVTINAGEGGRFKSVNDFVDGDFDGYRVYTIDGSYSLVKTSFSAGGQINLILDTLNSTKYQITSPLQELLITPNAEEIEFIFAANPADNMELPLQQYNFPITERVGKCRVIVYKTVSASYNVKYRFKHLDEYSEWLPIPTDTTNGYYSEDKFDVNGNLVIAPTPTRTFYTSHATNGFIPVMLNPSAYGNFNLGDVLGIEHFNPTNIKKDLYVGTNKQHQVFGHSLSLTSDLYIELKKTLNDDSTVIRNGNKFWIQIKTSFNLNSYAVRFVQDYVIGTPTYDLLYELSADDINYISNNSEGINLMFEFDGTDWIVSKINEIIPISDFKDLDTTGLTYKVYTDAAYSCTPTKVVARYKKVGKKVSLYFRIYGNDCSQGTGNPTSYYVSDLYPALSSAGIDIRKDDPKIIKKNPICGLGLINNASTGGQGSIDFSTATIHESGFSGSERALVITPTTAVSPNASLTMQASFEYETN